MKALITGRIFEGTKLLGYKLWLLSNDKMNCVPVSKTDMPNFFKQYNVINCSFDEKHCSVKSNIGISISDYPRYNKRLGISGKSKYTDSDIIAISLNKDIDNVRITVCGALIYGAITDPYSDKAQNHAELYYEEIRKMRTDIIRISRNTGLDSAEVLKIKNYLFMQAHELENGYRRFDPNFHIAQSWQRLMSKNKNDIKNHDLTLLNHELLEMSLIESGMSQQEAHTYAQGTYNYGKESDEYYDKLKKHI